MKIQKTIHYELIGTRQHVAEAIIEALQKGRIETGHAFKIKNTDLIRIWMIIEPNTNLPDDHDFLVDHK